MEIGESTVTMVFGWCSFWMVWFLGGIVSYFGTGIVFIFQV